MVAARVLARGGIRLLAGGRGVEVLQDDEDRILLVVDGIGHTGGQSRMPESAVAENGDHALAEARRHRARRRQAQAVTEDGVALVEGRQGREGVTADIRRHMRFPQLALGDLEGAEHRTLRATRAEGGRPRGKGRLQEVLPTADVAHEGGAAPLGITTEEAREGGQHHFRHVLALGGYRVFAFDAHAERAVVGESLELLLDEVGHALFEHRDPTLPLEEIDELLGHERMDHVQHEERDSAPAEDVGLAQELERAKRGRREPALEDDADLLLLTGDDLVEPALQDIAARGR